MNILLISPGRRNYLVNYFLDLKKKFNLNLYLIDPNKNIPSFCLLNTKNFICPQASKKKKFKTFLRKFVKQKKIKIIFPLSHWELTPLSEEKEYYENQKVKVVVSSLKTIKNCTNKLKSIELLKKYNLPFPSVINFKKIKYSLPIIKKRIFGNASKDQQIFRKMSEIPKKNMKNFFFQKFIKYDEFGMDILNDLEGNYVHSCTKQKLLLRAGDTDQAKIVNKKKFFELAKKISKATKHIGVLDVDFLFNGNKIYILDLNPRIGGGYPFTHEAGYNYLEQILNWATKKKKNIKFKKKLKSNIFSKGISLHRN